jgi:tetratricopeptide (TPR) repeat protein
MRGRSLKVGQVPAVTNEGTKMKRRLRCEYFGPPVLILVALFIRPVLDWGQDSSYTTDDRIAQIYLQAQEAKQRENYQEAAEKYSAILKLKPDAFEARVDLGLMHHLLGEYAEAIRDFEIVVRQKPRLFVANLFLGLDLLQLQQPRRALTYLECAQRLQPKDVQPALQLGRAYADLHEVKKANEWYLRATAISPGNADAWYGLGITHLHLARASSEQLAKEGQGSVYARRLYAELLEERGWVRDAVSAYQKLLVSPSAPACSHAELGFAYLVQGDETLISAAQKHFDQALTGDPGCLLARLGAARIYYQDKNTASAVKELAEIWKADPNFFKANASRLWQGLNADRLENLEDTIRHTPMSSSDQALADYLVSTIEQSRRGAIDTAISAEETASEKADTRPSQSKPDEKQATPAKLYGQGRYTSCAQRLKPRLDKSSSDDLLLLAACSYDSGDYRLSFGAACQLLRIDSHSLAALYWQARSSQRLGVAALTRAGLAEPNSPRIHLLVAEAYREKGSFSEAEAEYGTVLQLEPNYVPAHLGLAMVYWQEHRYEQAIPHLQTVLASRPRDPESSYIMGAILVERHQFTEAVPYLDSALAGTSAILPHVHALRSKVYAAEGKTEAAVTEIKQSLGADRDGAYHYQLYRFYKTLGDEEGAKTALQESETLHNRRNVTTEDAANYPP